MKKIIINGIIVTHDKSTEAMLSIEDGIITEIAVTIPYDESKVGVEVEIIDAKGCFILPGAVDMYTRLGLGSDASISLEAFRENSLACLYGGTTTVIEEVVYDEDCQTIEDLIEYAKNFNSSSYVDYSVHQEYFEDFPQLENNTQKITTTKEGLSEHTSLQKIIEGFPSFRLSMLGEKAITDEQILSLVKKASPIGATTFVHIESPNPIKALKSLHQIKKQMTPYALTTSRPNYVEREAFSRMCNLSRATGSTFALECVSTKEVVKDLYEQKGEGLPISVLTSPEYLVLNDDRYLSHDIKPTYAYCVEPPLRKKVDSEALWKAIKDGIIHCIISKHTGVSLEHKQKTAQNNIFNIPSAQLGVPNGELRLTLLYTFGVLENKISINKLVEITATHVTRIAGLRTKGRIEAGTDADIIIFDPNHKKMISHDTLHDTSDYSPYEGMKLQGFARDVFLRGEQMIKNFELIQEKPKGKLVFRKAVAIR